MQQHPCRRRSLCLLSLCALVEPLPTLIATRWVPHTPPHTPPFYHCFSCLQVFGALKISSAFRGCTATNWSAARWSAAANHLRVVATNHQLMHVGCQELPHRAMSNRFLSHVRNSRLSRAASKDERLLRQSGRRPWSTPVARSGFSEGVASERCRAFLCPIQSAGGFNI